MESIGPANLLYFLYSTPPQFPDGSLPFWHKLVAALYVLHYLNRAIITPLFLAPSMSPIHLSIMLSAASFNYFNSSCIGGWLLGYGTPILGSTSPTAYPPSVLTEYLPSASYLPYIGIVIFAIGMYGNIRAEGTLFRLRREEADRRATATAKDSQQKQGSENNKKNRYDKVYVLPPATGYFRSMLFPHYVSEWFEWLGFLLIAFAITPEPSSPLVGRSSSSITGMGPTPVIPLAPYYAPLADSLLNKLKLPFPFPAIMFFVNVVTTTAARASWGRKWYVEKYGEERVGARGSFIPYFRWL